MASITKGKGSRKARSVKDSSARSSKVRRDWRELKTAQQCLSSLCLSDNLSDVAFAFASHPTVKLPAHKFILCMRSAVFEAMFYGPMAEGGDGIRITDIEPDIMKELLRYIYSDSANLTGHNVLACLYGAKKYALTGLESACSSYLENNLTIDSACSILEQANFYGIQQLQTRCFAFILENAKQVFETQDFLQISQQTLVKLLQSDNLTDEEKHVFQACLKWSEHQCQFKKLEKTSENKRTVLGDALFQIRFPIMQIKDFAQLVSPSGLLTNDEQVTIYQNLAAKTPISEQKFVSRERIGLLETIIVEPNNCTFGNRGRVAGGYNLQMHINCDQYHATFAPRSFSRQKETEKKYLQLVAIAGSFVPEIDSVLDGFDRKIEFVTHKKTIKFKPPISVPDNSQLFLKFVRSDPEVTWADSDCSENVNIDKKVGERNIQVRSVPAGTECISLKTK